MRSFPSLFVLAFTLLPVAAHAEQKGGDALKSVLAPPPPLPVDVPVPASTLPVLPMPPAPSL